ncbi:hypothetical protein MBLNU13_g08962t1 [Cladosporium sp. NU13]
MTSTLEHHSFFTQACPAIHHWRAPLSIRDTSAHVQALTAALLHPNFSSAPGHSTQLIIRKPLSSYMPLKGRSLPTLKDIEDLLRSMPNLKVLTIVKGRFDRIGDRNDHEEAADKGEIQIFNKSRGDLGPRFLRTLVRMHPDRLTSLILHNMTISSDLLVNVLCTFYVSLRHVDLTAIRLQGPPKKAASWEAIFKNLREMNLGKLHLEDLVAPGTPMRMLMSSLPFKYEKLGHMCHTEEDPNVSMDQVQGGCATHTLWSASFRQDYFKKGLEKPLGMEDLPVYLEEWAAGDGDTMKLVTVQLL